MKAKKYFAVVVALVSVMAFRVVGVSASEASKTRTVYFAPMTGIVGVPMEEYVASVFERIGDDGDAILVFKMDTPGGLVDSMSQIMSRIAESSFPVVVWVAPSGAHAASAGAFIVQAAHVAVMAPETNIGASHPVTGSGGDIDDGEMSRKVVNDLLAKMRSFARERGRNADVAESMVRDSVSLSAREAFEQYVIDYIASDEAELVSKLDGRTVSIRGKETVISVGNFEVKNLEMGLRFRALEAFSRPDIAYLALIAGIILIVIELKSPGGFVLGVTGGILLLVAAYGMRVLPVNFAGVALVVVGLIVIVADMAVGGIGILAVPGLAAMLVGGFLVYRAPGAELLNVSAGFIFGATFALGVLMFVVLRMIYRALRRKPSSGEEGLVGSRAAILEKTESGRDIVMIHGEYWRISCDGSYGELSAGDEVEVIGVESTTLIVKPIKRTSN